MKVNKYISHLLKKKDAGRGGGKESEIKKEGTIYNHKEKPECGSKSQNTYPRPLG